MPDETPPPWRYGEPGDYEAPASAGEEPSGAGRADSGGEGGIGQIIGVAIFVAIIASQVCRALTDSE